MAPRKHSLRFYVHVCMCVCVLTHTCSLWAEESEMKGYKPTFWNLEIARARWLGHCAPRCHRETLARWARAAHMACWLSSFLDGIM